METQVVTVARIYLREGEHILPNIIRFLHDEEKVSGVTVLRGIAGFSADGKVHTASLVDLSMDLPLIVEFYDEPDRVDAMVRHLVEKMGLPHIVTWPATSHNINRS